MIKIVRLVSGDELVAQIPDECFKPECEELQLKMPVRFVLSDNGLGIMPFCPFAKDNVITINKKHVLFMVDLEDEIRNAYNAQFGTGIVTASAPSLDLSSLRG